MWKDLEKVPEPVLGLSGRALGLDIHRGLSAHSAVRLLKTSLKLALGMRRPEPYLDPVWSKFRKPHEADGPIGLLAYYRLQPWSGASKKRQFAEGFWPDLVHLLETRPKFSHAWVADLGPVPAVLRTWSAG